MKKKITLMFSLMASTIIFSQVGINTTNPKGIFHVDGLKNNPSSGNPSISQQSDDFIVMDNGNTGLGTNTPNTKLHVTGEITVDNTKNSSIPTILLNMTKVRAAAGTTWQLPLGWKADNTLGIISSTMQTSLNYINSTQTVLLTVPSVLWSNNANNPIYYIVKVEGYYNDGCNPTGINHISMFFNDNKFIVFFNGQVMTVTNPSPQIYTWSLNNSCGYTRSITYNANTKELSSSSTGGGSTTLVGTATVYGNAYQ